MLKIILEWSHRCARRILYISEWKLYAWCMAVVVLTTAPTLTIETLIENWTIHVLLYVLFARLLMVFTLFWCRMNAVIDKLTTLMHMVESSNEMDELNFCKMEHMKLLKDTKELYPMVAVFLRPAFLGAEKFIKDTKHFLEEEDETE